MAIAKEESQALFEYDEAQREIQRTIRDDVYPSASRALALFAAMRERLGLGGDLEFAKEHYGMYLAEMGTTPERIEEIALALSELVSRFEVADHESEERLFCLVPQKYDTFDLLLVNS